MSSGFESSVLHSDFVIVYQAARRRLLRDYNIALPMSIDWEIVEERTYLNRWVSYIRDLEALLNGRELVISHYILRNLIGFIKAWRDAWIEGSRHCDVEDKAATIADEYKEDFMSTLNQLGHYTAAEAIYILMLAPFAPVVRAASFRPLNQRGDLDPRLNADTLCGHSKQELLSRAMGLGYRPLEPYESGYFSLDKSFGLDAVVCCVGGVPHVALPMEYTPTIS